jgi:hypothetical protein
VNPCLGAFQGGTGIAMPSEWIVRGRTPTLNAASTQAAGKANVRSIAAERGRKA